MAAAGHDSGIDPELLAEYLHDHRGAHATTPFQDDVFAGLRLAFNAVVSSEALLGSFVDRDSDVRIVSLKVIVAVERTWPQSRNKSGGFEVYQRTEPVACV